MLAELVPALAAELVTEPASEPVEELVPEMSVDLAPETGHCNQTTAVSPATTIFLLDFFDAATMLFYIPTNLELYSLGSGENKKKMFEVPYLRNILSLTFDVAESGRCGIDQE